MILQKINEGWKDALRNKNTLKKDTLAMLRAVIKNAEIEKKGTLDDVAIVALINKEIKKRNDASDAYIKAGRVEQGEKEAQEAVILKEFLPSQLSQEEVHRIIEEVIQKQNAFTLKDMGPVMKEASAIIAGRADNKVISLYIRERLSN